MGPIRDWQLSNERIAQFDSAAEHYDRNRSPFPEAAFDRLAAIAQLRPNARVLEVGAGTGRATIELVRRGYRVTAIEPGPALRAIGKAKLADADPAVEWVGSTFEAWSAPAHAFDLVFSADAWHWVQPIAGARRAASLLAAGGYLGVLWLVMEGFEPAEFMTALVEAWTARGLLPDVERWIDEMSDDGAAWIEPISSEGLFAPPARSWHPAPLRLSGAEAAAAFGSYGWVLALPPERQGALVEAVREVAQRDFRDEVVRRDAAVLYVLRRTDASIPRDGS